MIKGVVKTKEFVKKGNYNVNDTIDNEINNFLEEHKITSVIDIKYVYSLLSGSSESYTRVLLTYREPVVDLLSKSQYNDEFGIKGE